MIKSITRFITIAALFLIPLFPLIVVDQYFFPFITGKAFYFRFLIEIAFAAWVILACVDSKYRPRINAISIGVTAFAIIAFVADILGVNPIRSMWSNFERMEGWITIIHLWMFYMTASSVFGSSEERTALWHKWFLTEMGVATVISVYGLLQIAGVLAIHQGSVRIDASLGNAAYMAVYMLMNVGIAVYMLVSSKNKWTLKIQPNDLWVYWFSFVISVVFVAAITFSPAANGSPDSITTFFNLIGGYAKAHALWFVIGLIVTVVSLLYPAYILPFLFSFLLFETATRGTILGLIGGIMLSLLLYTVFAPKSEKISRWISGGVIGLIVIIGLVFWLNRNQPFIQKNDVLQRLASISWNETKTQARAYIWPMALKGFSERPVLGWGQENFNYVFNYNYNPKMWTQEQWFDRAHSVFLDWLIAAGIVGFLSYISLYILALIIIWRSKFTVAEKSILTGLIAGYAVHNIFVFDNLASYVLFFALLSFIGSALSEHNVVGTKKRQRLHASGVVLGGNRVISDEVSEYVVMPLAIIAVVLGLYFFNVRAVMANRNLISALQSCSSQNPDTATFDAVFNVGVYVGQQEAREQLISCSTSVIRNTQIPGPTRQAFLELANREIENQIKSTPKDARVYVLGGSFFNSVGQATAATPLLEKAHALTPGKQTVDFELANAYLNNGKPDEGLALLKQAYESDPTYPQAATAYAMGLIITGKENQARELFKNDPKIFETESVGQIYIALKQYDKAVALYKKFLSSDPKNVDVAAKLAQVEYLSGMKAEAIATLRNISKDHPEYKDQIDTAIKQIQAE